MRGPPGMRALAGAQRLQVKHAPLSFIAQLTPVHSAGEPGARIPVIRDAALVVSALTGG